MSGFGLAWRVFLRQPARSALGVLGVAIVGALLLDMLLLSRGLVVSMQELLDAAGADLRVTATDAPIGGGTRLRATRATLREIERLPEVEGAFALRFGRAFDPEWRSVRFHGAAGKTIGTWRILEGRGLPGDVDAGADDPPPLLASRALAEEAGLAPGSRLLLRGQCSQLSAVPRPVEFEVVGIVELFFDAAGDFSTVVPLDAYERACGVADPDAADLLLVRSSESSGTSAAVEAVRRARPDLHVFSNAELVEKIERRDLSYFRQISFVLSTLTVLFAFLLVATLLTVSVNQRLAEVAALRALGFSRGRVVADLLWESALLVGTGGLLSLPLGAALARWLDGILRGMGGMPEDLHFFVAQPRAVLLHACLLVLTGVAAAAYPIVLAARLPISATLRREVVS